VSDERDAPIRVLIADDHPVFRSGLRDLLEREAGVRVVAEAEDGEMAVARIAEHRPDVAVLDLDMPKLDAFAVIAEIRRRGLRAAVMVLTGHRDEALVNKACDLGIKGFILKDAPVAEIGECIRAVHAGETYISPRLSATLLNRADRAVSGAKNSLALSDLTPTERRILTMIADQQSTKQIADALFISVRTVDRHRSNLCEKLDLHGVNTLIKFAISHRSEL
jgi:DNA-binding NarL/FixJ family response regulator